MNKQQEKNEHGLLAVKLASMIRLLPNMAKYASVPTFQSPLSCSSW
jgi:hypothetical protein